MTLENPVINGKEWRLYYQWTIVSKGSNVNVLQEIEIKRIAAEKHLIMRVLLFTVKCFTNVLFWTRTFHYEIYTYNKHIL